MSSNIDEENDLDFDASVSSINSDSEKVDSSLVKQILLEMKSEFNRGTTGNSEDGNELENDNSSEESETNDGDRETGLVGSIDDESVHIKEEDDNAEDLSDDISENCNSNKIVSKVIFDGEEGKNEEQKPRIILTFRPSEEDREIGSRTGRRSLVSSYESEFSVKNDSNNVGKTDIEVRGSNWESRSRRSLRSSSRVTDRENDNSGMTRSSRRFSKEHSRESVLQSAIARKEKSFSNLSQLEERNSRRSSRSPRQSPNDPRLSKSNVMRSKSPKPLNYMDKCSKTEFLSEFDTSSKLDDVCNTEPPVAIKSEPDLDLAYSKVESYDFSDNSNDTNNMNSASTNSQTSETPADAKPMKVDKYYTKTGKRRTKHFKGLKYSLTTGGSVRRKSIHVAKRGRKKKQVDTDSAGMCVGSEHLDDEIKRENDVADQTEMIDNDENDYEESQIKEEPNSHQGEVCITQGTKRKFESEDAEEDDESVSEDDKRCRTDTVSPSQADTENEPDKPEASETTVSVGVGSASLCLCNRKTVIYTRPVMSEQDAYCQAVDSLDGRFIGCCNTVNKEGAQLLRPSVRIPYLTFCDVHTERLQRHNCCPTCGIFCTQGVFLQCCSYHQYHKGCQLTENGKDLCPHCGKDGGSAVNISLGAHKYPVFLPLQTPNKKMPSAKMSFTYSVVENNDEMKFNGPLVLADSLVLPSGLQITSQGLPAPLDKDKLDTLLHVACSLDPRSFPRYTLRNMYQSAKHGETEKMIHMLAAGLNPNHIFREWGMGSALHAACYGGHLPVVHVLLQAGANTDVLDRDQNTPLMLACANGHNQVVKYLVKAGASVTFKGGDGMTALHLAAKSGNVEACYYLISNPNTPRSFIDSVDDGRWTPLVWAAEHKHCHVVKFLLEKRADPLVRDAEQNIALHWAALSGSIDISEALLNYGSDVNSTNAHADTPLHIAARQNAYECVTLLLARGARVDVHNRAGFLPHDCVSGAPNDTYTAIKLNVELRNILLNVQKRTAKLLTNDITRGHEANPVQCVNGVDDEPEPQDFVYVSENCFTSNINIDRTITSLQSCKCRDTCISGACMCGKISFRCWYDDEGKLLPEFNFADPPMLFECNQACACNRLTCKNRVVQHGMTARFQLFRTKNNKGWGVRTLRLIPKGSYVCEYIGEIISDCEADTREDDSYLFDLDNRDGETYCIDARRYGNIARFINHSCMPNLLPVRVFIDHQDLHFPRIAFFANTDIQAYEELGFDYGAKFWIIKSKLFTCTCGKENCKYSETTIAKTLANYNKRLKQEDID